MQKQTFTYEGDNALDIVDLVAEELDKLPYEAMYSQYEGNEEVFFYSVVNAFDEEYQCFVTSALSLCIQTDRIQAEIIATAPQTDMGLEALPLKKQMAFWHHFFIHHCFVDEHDKCECAHHH